MKESESWEILVSLSENEISIAEAHDQILRLFNVVRQSEQFYCWESGEAGVENPLCDKQCAHCSKLYPKQLKCVDTKHYTGITKCKTYKIFKNPNGSNYPHTRFIHVTNDLGIVKAYLKNCFEAF